MINIPSIRLKLTANFNCFWHHSGQKLIFTLFDPSFPKENREVYKIPLVTARLARLVLLPLPPSATKLPIYV